MVRATVVLVQIFLLVNLTVGRIVHPWWIRSPSLRRLYPSPKASLCSGAHVEMLVSPVVEDGYNRRITFHWENLPSNSQIGIFSKDPVGGSETPLFTYSPTASNGWANSSVEEPHIAAEQLGFTGRCINLYIAYKTGNNWQGTSCLRIEPTWMDDLRETIGRKRIMDLYIPGTHDSSAYKEFDPDNPDNRVMKYSVTQDEPILGQLIYGARHLDLRPAHYPRNENEWWGNHGFLQFHPMSEILGNLTQFLQNTKEIVVLDVHEFPVGFDNIDIHRQFVKYLEDLLGEYAVPSSFAWEATLDEIWATGRQLIIGYNYGSVTSESQLLWPAVHQSWGDVQHVEDLMEYLQSVVSNRPGGGYSCMAQLTPSASDIAFDTMKGLRHAAEAVNHDVTTAFRNDDWAKNTNIVAIDFLRGSGIVRAAIEYNSEGAACT